MGRREKRKFERLRTRALTWIKDPKTGKVVRGLTNDISAGGVCVVVDKVYQPGTELELEIELSDLRRSVKFVARVVRTEQLGEARKRDEDPPMKTGLVYIRLDPKDQSLLMQYAHVNAPPSESTP